MKTAKNFYLWFRLGYTFHFITVHINKNSNPIKKETTKPLKWGLGLTRFGYHLKKRRFAIRLKKITRFNPIGDQYCE